tara:strand:+ start:754 stop:1383 length:630 start_codon:yes stop_codon:yes gene_type:complete
MKEVKTNSTYKGTRILIGNEKRKLLNQMIDYLYTEDYTEIALPNIQYQETFKSKVGEENNNLMFNFSDRGNKELCLAPEYTAVVQPLSNTYFWGKKDVKLFYIQECFRGEKPQKGRYRQFTQLGIEILNPSDPKETLEMLEKQASNLIEFVTSNYELTQNVKRGLDYYNNGLGFEISCSELGSSSQVCGGGIYENGVGYSIGIDRILLL